MRRTVLLVAVAGLAVLGLTLGVREAVASHSGASTAAAPAGASTVPTADAGGPSADAATPSPGVLTSAPLDPGDDVARVDADAVPDLAAVDLATARAMGWDITVRTPVDRLDDAQKASRRLAVQGMHTRLVGLSLARVTIHGYGTPVDPDVDPRGDEDLHLLVEDRLFWVAVSRHVPIPAGGPSRSPQPTRAYGYSDVIMLIEPGRSTSSIAQTLSAG